MGGKKTVHCQLAVFYNFPECKEAHLMKKKFKAGTLGKGLLCAVMLGVGMFPGIPAMFESFRVDH